MRNLIDHYNFFDPLKKFYKAGENVEVLAKYDGRIVAAREGNVLTCAFHPELSSDTRFLQIFLEIVVIRKQKEV